MYRGTKIKMTADFLLELMQARRQWSNIFKVFKEKKVTLKFYEQYKYLPKAKVKYKLFQMYKS